MDKKEKITILKRAGIAFLSAIIGSFAGAIAVLLTGAENLDDFIKGAVLISAIFALLGFIFPKQMIRVLFILTLFQPG